MNNKLVMTAGVLVLLAVTAAGTWYAARRELVACIVDDSLQPIAALLEDDAKILKALQSEQYAASESAILDSYLTRIRRDGVPKNAGMKQRIDQLVNNNTVIVALLSRYSTHARTAAFRAAADRFRDYAIPFRDRWQSVFEIFMAGGNLPAAGPSFPTEMTRALVEEMRHQ
jgi:hypothetical protein